MAADATLSIEVIAKIANYTKQMEEAANKTKESTDKMKTEFDKLSEGMKELGKLTAYLATVYAVGRFFGNAIKETNEYNLEINKLSRSMDISLEKASALKEALGDLGIDANVVRMAQQRLTIAMRENAAALDVLGVNTKDANGNLRSSFDVLMDVIEATKSYSSETDRSRLLSRVFGRGSEQTKELLRLTKEELISATEEVKQYGRVVDNSGVAQTRAWNRSIGDLYDRVSDSFKSMGKATMAFIAIFDQAFRNDLIVNYFAELKSLEGQNNKTAESTKRLSKEQQDLLGGIKSIADEAPKMKVVIDSMQLDELPIAQFKPGQVDFSFIVEATENLTLFNEKYVEFQLNNQTMIESLQTSIETTTQIFTALTSGFSSAITGMLTGTMSFSEGFKMIMRSAITSVIQLFVSMALQKALSGLLEKKVVALKALTEVGAAAAVAGANAYAFNAWNPPLAMAASAAAYAKTMAFATTIPAFERGGNVANDGLALLHKNEMVLPSPIADSVRNITEGGMGAGSVTFNINAMDASSFDTYLKANAGSVFAANKLALRNGSQFA